VASVQVTHAQLSGSDVQWTVTWQADDPERAYLEEFGLVAPQVRPAGGESLELVAIPGCRVFDTRNDGAGAYGGGAFREFSLANADIPLQGGKAGGCGIPPAGTKAVAMRLTTVTGSPTTNGFIRAGKAGEDPASTVLAFVAGLGISVTTTTLLDNNNAMRVTIFGGTTHIVGDLVGYYRSKLHATVNADGTLRTGSGVVQIEKLTTNAPGEYLVFFNRDISECTVVASPYFGNNVRVNAAKDFEEDPGERVLVTIFGFNNSTPTDAQFNLIVSC